MRTSHSHASSLGFHSSSGSMVTLSKIGPESNQGKRAKALIVTLYRRGRLYNNIIFVFGVVQMVALDQYERQEVSYFVGSQSL